jgi:two-component system sensor histidine kinase KdpD
MVPDMVEAFHRRVPDRGIGLSVPDDVSIVLAEPTFLSEVLDNLLTNAHKYSRSGTTIEVRVEPTEAGGAQICVRDYGEGIAQDELDRVFDAFYRSPASAKKARGLGLGLAVCKRVIEAMGGTIWAVARPEGGSDFIFTLQPAGSSADK